MELNGKFYLGRLVDAATGQTSGTPVRYDPDDLTTHAVVVGMTGSGKTGLCLDLMEEAALAGIPALMIDPKGDITNALLHFPDLLPDDFRPWVDPDQARRAGKSMDQAAADAAQAWRAGLAEWEIGPERLRALKNAAAFAVYTPGSDAGLPVSILASLKAPAIPWEGNRELLREKIAGTVTALLGLVGLTDVDPVRSREHILLANIFEQAWSQGQDLDLAELILQTQKPPFAKLGVFDVNTFFPEKDRFALAMLLNNILAAPAFQTWIEGQPLEVASLLYAPDGRPRHSVFYIAHLGDAERMFFVTLLLSAVESWMRTQAGTPSLRALVYFDEIFGFLPPVANPPSKQPMLRLLKQARAFGVGQVLVTQNPVDVDYKALSNAGTWFIGKLQTDQDKQRLLDGLQGALGGNLDRRLYDGLISRLGRRVFLLHNVHNPAPELFQTRWSMNFLAGPLTRTQIPALNLLAGAIPSPAPVTPAEATPELANPDPPAGPTGSANNSDRSLAASAPALDAFQPIPVGPPGKAPVKPARQPGMSEPTPATRPPIPNGIAEYFLPNNLNFVQAFKAANRAYPANARNLGLIYRPALLAQASVRFLNRKYNLDFELVRTALVTNPDRRGIIRWENYPANPLHADELEDQPGPQVRFATLEEPLTTARVLAGLQKDFLDWVYRTSQVTVLANDTLKLYAGPEISQAEFRTDCANLARQGRDAESKKAADEYDRKIQAIQGKLEREARELEQDRTELSQRKMEEFGTNVENVFGLFGGRRTRKLSTSLSKHRLTEQAKAEVDESIQAMADYKRQIVALEQEKARALAAIQERWSQIASQITEIPVTAFRKDVRGDLFGVAWFPYYEVQIGSELSEVPAFQAG